MKYIIKNNEQRVFQNRFYHFDSGKLLSPVETQNYTIVQVAESYYIHGFSIGKHRQICDLELTFSHMNGLTCFVGDGFASVDKHHLHLAFEGEMHGLESKRGARFQTLAVNFKKGPCLTLLDAVRKKAREGRIFSVPEIFGHFTEIISEFVRSDKTFFENNLDSLITCVLVKLARCGEEGASEEISSYDNKIAEMKNYVDSRFIEIGSLEELAYHFGYTYSHLSKIFKKAYGVTPSDYLLGKKMDYACTLLKEGAKLEEISVVLGYSTTFNFSRAFKNRIGLSPSAYRKRIK